MAYGYSGINFRDIAEAVGIKAASINYYFANKAILGEAVARRYWEDIARDLESLFRRTLEARSKRCDNTQASFAYLWNADQSHVPQQLHGDRI